MKSRFITDLQDPSDSLFSTDGAEFYTSLLPSAGNNGGNPFGNVPVEILPTPSLSSQSVASTGGQSVPNSVVAVTSGGITINLIFDAAALAAPASFRADIQQAATMLSGSISDKITVNINIDYSGTGGGAAAGPDNGLYESYSAIRADLINNATPGDTTFNALPSGSSIQGQSSVAVWNPELKLFGLLGANDTTTDDGSATFATDIDPNLLVGVALHELTHALGRVPYGPQPDIFDLFRFTSPGARLFAGGNTAPATYFSVDGGNTKLADYGQNSDPSDFLNTGIQGPNDPFNEYYSGSTTQSLSTVDKQLLDALGFNINSVVRVIEAAGSTSLTEVGTNFYLYSSAGSGPSLKMAGVNVDAVQYGAWAPIGAEQTAGGYEVAWKVTGSDNYTVWNTDSNGNYTSDTIGVVSGSSYALESLEASFHQDLNGDGVIGIPPLLTTVIEAFGLTSLVEVGQNFYLDSISSGSGPELKYAGAAVAAGQFGGWAPIGAEQTASGYQVAWKVTGADQYTVWNTDSSGNFVSDTIGIVSGSSTALESLETSFHQDLNGDGVIGIPPSPTSAALELAGANSDSVTFTGSPSILILQTPSAFSGQIIGFTGDGTLAGSDQIDLRGMSYNRIHSGYNSSTGVLDVSDGTTTVDLKFAGTYSQANFKFADDGNGGTIVYDPPASGAPASLGGATDVAMSQIAGTNAVTHTVTPGQDSFIFAPNFGQVTLANFALETDTIQFGRATFANINAVLAATRDDAHGNAVITDAAHDTITIQHVTAAQLLAHQGDFHFV